MSRLALPRLEDAKARAIDAHVPVDLLRRVRGVWRYATRHPHEADFAFFARFRDTPGTFLDVGANMGQSALSIRMFARAASIVSVEPNALLGADLRFARRLVGDMEIVGCAAGAEPGRFTLHVPVYRGVTLPGDASLDRAAILGPGGVRRFLGDRVDGPGFEIRAQEVEVVPLDRLGLAPAWVKIDVEGVEGDVVRGLRGTIERHRPLLLVESTSHREVAAELAGLDYAARRYDRERRALVPLAADGVPVNVFFVPGERAAELAEPGPPPPRRLQAPRPGGRGRDPDRRR